MTSARIISADAYTVLRERAPDRIYLLADAIQACLDRCAQSETPDGWDWATRKNFRFPPLPHYHRKPQQGRCRICWLDAGKWTWHKECASAYNFFTSPNSELLAYLQDCLCPGCGDAVGYARRYEFSTGDFSEWRYVIHGSVEADHVKPLYRVRREHADEPWTDLLRFWTPLNLQAICRACHVRKCGQEATERATHRRHDDRQEALL